MFFHLISFPDHASSVISLRARLTHGRMYPCDRSSSLSASSRSICKLPLSSVVAHVPRRPSRQHDGIKTPSGSELCNEVSSGDMLHVTPEREKLTCNNPSPEAE